MAATASRTEKLTEERLEQLAQDPNNVVYKYEDKHDAEPALSADIARNIVREIRKRYGELRAEHPTWTDDRVRERLCVESKDWKAFATTHKMLFSKTTDRGTDEAQMKHVFYILFMHKQRETGALTPEECNKQVQEYMLRQFMTDKKAEEGTYAPIVQ